MSATPANSLPPLSRLRPWIDRFDSLRLVVWGDIVGDRFLYGSTIRVSREAPALVLRHESEELRPGGAGNAMMNVAALGARVAASGYLGTDAVGEKLEAALREAGIVTDDLIRRRDSRTPVKTRVMAGGLHTVRQQVLRIDHDWPWPVDERQRANLAEALAVAVEQADALVISDYGLGSVEPGLHAQLSAALAERDLPVILDSRRALLEFAPVTAATPNEGEVEEALRVRLDGKKETLEKVGQALLERLGSKALLITRGSRGMAVFEPGRMPAHLPIHGTDQIADVTGAGDTVIAAFTLGLVAGAPTLEAAQLANVAGCLTVMKRGTATVSRAELIAAIERDA